MRSEFTVVACCHCLNAVRTKARVKTYFSVIRAPGWEFVSELVNLPTPDYIVEKVVALIFGSPSIQLSIYLLLSLLWAWINLAKDALNLLNLIRTRIPRVEGEPDVKVGSTLRLAVNWFLLYVPASFAVAFWGRRHGLSGQAVLLHDLLRWSMLFGALSLLANFIIVPSRSPRRGDRRWAPLIAWGSW